ncbi:CaiB/BaiF CoA transferase family protein [Marininema halotolerans]|uniref:Crotonobetainyl-CoA:carnitine CoA-transferase CaiB n=1 Tax=Marininema halotolerans TaxID=1155944 RepID=A0A1I6QNL2_9BACL|nr:CoA transferase [Marininema halotolerans]SFS54047.1 Crotonobetainyl-CoA:carnitine CoA-transferase CaiB [Marininema halotolerans]
MLEGVRVLDFTQNLPGPFASMRLAQRGAEVVKVEPPSGDPARFAGEKRGETGLVFLANNRRKRSLCLDLKRDTGREIAQSLAAQADVILEGFRPGVMERLGLGYQAVARRNPRVVYASLTGYGIAGEVSRLGSHDLNYLALSGMLSQFKAQGKPTHPTILLGDLIGGLSASESILAALFQRSNKGVGTHLPLTLTGAVTELMHTHDTIWRETGGQQGIELLGGGILSYGLFETSDQKWMALAALEPKFWHNFCEALGKPHWMGAQYTPPVVDNAIYRELKEMFCLRTREEWTQFGLETDCCLTPVLEVGEWKMHPGIPQHHEEVDAPEGLGQDSVSVLSEWLDASESQVVSWKENGVVR